ncbi:MAG: hypothetical protein Q9219_000470 [cf. Caloplaca sp. 3 TL-2023]
MSQLDNPSQWTTGGEAPTEKQKSFISTLASSKDADVDPSSLNKSEASAKINELKEQPTQNANASAGDDKATGKQMGYVAVMAKKAGEDVPGQMGKTEASQKIEDLKGKTGM